MRKWSGVRGVGIIVALVWAVGLAAEPERQTPVPETEPIPVRDFFRNSSIRLPLVNEAGTYVGAIYDADDDQTGAVFVDLKAKKFFRLSGGHERDVVALDWMDDGHVLLYQTRRKLYAEGLYVVNVSNVKDNYPIVRHSAVHVISVPRKSPTKPIVWIRKDAYKDGSDYGPVQLNGEVNVDPQGDMVPGSTLVSLETYVQETGTAATVIDSYPAYPTPQAVKFIPNKDGELAFGLFSERGRDVLYVLQGKKKWVPSPLEADDQDVIGAGDEPNEIILLGPRQEGKPRALIRYDALSGANKGVLYQDDQYDPKGAALFRKPLTGKIVGVGVRRKTLENIWLDEEHKALGKELAAAFPGMGVNVLGWDNAQNMIVVAVYSDQMPAAYFTYYRDKKDYDRFASTRPWIDYKRMRPTQALKYKTRDGFKVEGYLTMPEGASKQRPAPLVVLAHGGPWSRDIWGWNAEVQFLASRGYAVFQPNFRGSDGYGWSFPATSAWDFRKMHEDVTDGTNKLIQSGLVDPKRIAIMGASFGGYLSVCGVAWEPSLYRCAITTAGVFDWEQSLAEDKEDRFDSLAYDVFLRSLGDPKQNAEAYRSISPIHQASGIKVPVFVAHGKDDRVVQIAQSKRLIAELEKGGVPYKKFFRGEEGHGMYRTDNEVELYTAIEAFLAENMK